MKIKHIYISDMSVILLALLLCIIANVGFVGYLLAILLIPHAVMIPPSLWYLTLSKILKESGDDKSIISRFNFLIVIGVMVVLMLFFLYFYFWRLGVLERGWDDVIFYLIAISHSLAVTTAIFTGLAAYIMSIRMSARGYKKLMK